MLHSIEGHAEHQGYAFGGASKALQLVDASHYPAAITDTVTDFDDWPHFSDRLGYALRFWRWAVRGAQRARAAWLIRSMMAGPWSQPSSITKRLSQIISLILVIGLSSFVCSSAGQALVKTVCSSNVVLSVLVVVPPVAYGWILAPPPDRQR